MNVDGISDGFRASSFVCGYGCKYVYVDIRIVIGVGLFPHCVK